MLNELEKNRTKGFSGKPVTSASFYFEASISHSGLLDKVNTVTGPKTMKNIKEALPLVDEAWILDNSSERNRFQQKFYQNATEDKFSLAPFRFRRQMSLLQKD